MYHCLFDDRIKMIVLMDPAFFDGDDIRSPRAVRYARTSTANPEQLILLLLGLAV